MGGAGVGTPWGGAPNQWANPAQLAYRQGVHYDGARYELARGLADDIVLTNSEFMFGHSGVSVIWGLWPASGLKLDMGNQEGVDENGDPTGTFSSYMKSRSYGVAVDAVQILDRFLSRTGHSDLKRYVSLSYGYVKKDYEDQLAPDQIIQDPYGGGSATANTHDRGWVVRVTPLNTLDTDGPLGFLLGGAYGESTLNGGDEDIHHVDASQSDPLPRAHLDGWSLHGEIAFGREHWRNTSPGFLANLYDTLNPLFSFTYASQSNVPGYRWDGDLGEYVEGKDFDYEETGDGWEMGLANIFFLRKGHFTAPYGDIDDDTSGWGINLQVNKEFGLRYDTASVPQATGLPRVDRYSWSFWVDPLAILAD
jgi:hypothetical protein